MTLKASNTNVTLAPKSIFEAAGEPLSKTLVDTLNDPAVQEKLAEEGKTIDWSAVNEFVNLEYDAINKASYEPENDMSGTERRIQRLEEQMDGLLDRLAKYNVRAQHRI